ncbi:PDZ domain-containing protein MAGIX [Melanerpes formicivorus]|uniref:PDZ domain-containing protein MAGIX n=1 Tax=Melanerpes formicivorus TaxID=211600 RepID=UPI00358DD9C3
MSPAEAPPVPSVSVVVVVGGACVLRYSRPPPPPPPAAPGPSPRSRRCPSPPERDLLLLLPGLRPGAHPEPVAVTSFVGPEPCDLLPAAPPGGELEDGSELGCSLGWPRVSDQLLAINGAPTAGMTHAQALARIRGGGSRLRLLLRRAQGPPQNGPGRGVLSLCVSSSPRGELCFCLVGRMDPPP